MSAQNTNAEIITIGDEILIGQIVDTNSAWLSQQLNLIGINVYQITSVSDNKDHIINALNEASSRVNLIIITGGLGPTRDDITKSTITGYFNSKLVRNPDVYKHIAKRMSDLNIPMNKLNEQQADVPDNCTVIPNEYGTAPCMWFEKDLATYIFMPGVPYEMKGIFAEQLKPRLINRYNALSIYHKTILLQGIAESELALLIDSWENKLPKMIKLAYLPSAGIIKLRLTAKGDQLGKLKNIVSIEVEKLMPIIKPYCLSSDDQQPEILIFNILKKSGLTLSVAESCTGGKIASLLTSVPGSSAYFKGGIVAYSNEIKIKSLNVDPLLIDKFGAVSEEVVTEMAKNILTLFKTDYSIAISGIAGPDGGTEIKPVGTTWVAVSSVNKAIAKHFFMKGNREQNIQRSANIALIEFLKLILSEVNISA